MHNSNESLDDDKIKGKMFAELCVGALAGCRQGQARRVNLVIDRIRCDWRQCITPARLSTNAAETQAPLQQQQTDRQTDRQKATERLEG